MTLNIERAETGSLSPDILAEVRSLCNEAYGEDLTGYFADIGPGVHLLGWHDSTLVSHLMWVLRTLYPAGAEPLQCAYVELVATRVSEQRRGFATRLMRRVAKEIRSHALGALSPPITPSTNGWAGSSGAAPSSSAPPLASRRLRKNPSWCCACPPPRYSISPRRSPSTGVPARSGEVRATATFPRHHSPITPAIGMAAAGIAVLKSFPSRAAIVAAIWAWVTISLERAPRAGVSGPMTPIQTRSAPSTSRP